MKAICIKECISVHDIKLTTVGKIYEIYNNNHVPFKYHFIGDNGNRYNTDSLHSITYGNWFKPIDEYRDEIIDDVLENLKR